MLSLLEGTGGLDDLDPTWLTFDTLASEEEASHSGPDTRT